MFATDDTIVAIATPHGRGALGVVRLSGPSAASIAGQLVDRPGPLVPRFATWCRLLADDGSSGSAIDEVVVTFFPGPRSFTGEDVVEICAHGSPVVLDAIVRSAMLGGARAAAPGEFTLRAFLNGKRDLIRCEAVRDLIDAETPLQARMAFDQLDGRLTSRIADIESRLFDIVARLEASLDFPDEGYHFADRAATAKEIETVIRSVDELVKHANEGRVIREGATVAFVGRANVGKSSLFNRLVGMDRAIVSPTAGTTRDLLTERLTVHGLAVTLVDTAGRRSSEDDVERQGIERASRVEQSADVVVVVVDASTPLSADDERCLAACASRRHVIALNKCDLPPVVQPGAFDSPHVVRVSARDGCGIDTLREVLVRLQIGRAHV